MNPYTPSDIRRILRETLRPATAPPPPAVKPPRPVPPADGTTRQLPLDGVPDRDGPTRHSYPAVPSVLELPATGSQPPALHPEDTWPETWITVPSLCPICDSPTTSDRDVNSSHGPGWRCTLDSSHYWQVRLASLRRYLAAHPPLPTYPWYDRPEAERRAWLEAHYQPPRLATGPLAVSALGC